MIRRGFTLIEVMAVCAIMGILAGAAAWSLAADTRAASTRDVLDRVVHADRMTRLAAQRLGRPCTLRIDLHAQTLRRIVSPDKADQAMAHAVRLPPSVRVDRVLQPRDPVTATDGGAVDVAYSTAGRSESFALRLTQSQSSRWIVFNGLSGQTVTLDDEDHAYRIMALLATGRPDPH